MSGYGDPVEVSLGSLSSRRLSWHGFSSTSASAETVDKAEDRRESILPTFGKWRSNAERTYPTAFKNSPTPQRESPIAKCWVSARIRQLKKSSPDKLAVHGFDIPLQDLATFFRDRVAAPRDQPNRLLLCAADPIEIQAQHFARWSSFPKAVLYPPDNSKSEKLLFNQGFLHPWLVKVHLESFALDRYALRIHERGPTTDRDACEAALLG